MAGVARKQNYYSFIVVLFLILSVFLVSISGEKETLSTEEAEELTSIHSSNLNENDGEVDIEEVENEEVRKAYHAYLMKTNTTENVVNFNQELLNSNMSRGTELATVYGNSENANDPDSGDLLSTTKTKPPRVKVACLGAMQESNIDFSVASDDPNLAMLMNVPRDYTKTLDIVNATTLLQDILYINPSIKSRANPSNCSVILFYARWCPFSAKAAPHFNALPRAFPSVRIAAVDSSMHPTVNTYFGILSVPTVILFHNGKIIAKFNDTSFTLNKFADFIQTFSDLKSAEKINVTSQDFHGPLPSMPVREIDYYLYAAWIFIVLCFINYVSKSSLWKKILDLIRTTWREAEAHHEHDD